ncbi:hypothetical protein ISCGN_013425 [Ixodes scapularis]
MSTNSPFVLFVQILIFNASFAKPAAVSGFCPARAWYAPSDCAWDDGAINSPGLSFGVSNGATIFGQFTSQAASTATDSPINEEASTAPDCGPGGTTTKMSTNSPFVLFVQILIFNASFAKPADVSGFCPARAWYAPSDCAWDDGAINSPGLSFRVSNGATIFGQFTSQAASTATVSPINEEASTAPDCGPGGIATKMSTNSPIVLFVLILIFNASFAKPAAVSGFCPERAWYAPSDCSWDDGAINSPGLSFGVSNDATIFGQFTSKAASTATDSPINEEASTAPDCGPGGIATKMSTNSPFVLFVQILIFNASFAKPAAVSGFCPARAWYAPSDCSWDDGAINSPGLSFGVSNGATIFGQFTSQAASTATDSPINEEASTAPDCGPGGIATKMSTNSPFVLFVQILIFNASFAKPAAVSGFCLARAWYAPSDCSWDDGAINSPGLSFGVSNGAIIFGQFTSQAASTATVSPINEEASTAPDCGPGGIATKMSTNSPSSCSYRF